MSFRSKNEDRLSNLPEDVLSHILSLMPTKFAVRTSTLSKTWRYNWTLVTDLDFYDYHPDYGLDCFSDFVDRVLKLCKTSQVNLFRLCFSQFTVQNSVLSNWINKAVMLNVCELDIQVTLDWSVTFEFPPSLLTCKTLTKLRLPSSNVLDVLDVRSPVMLPGLKTLHIIVPSKTSAGVNLSRFISGCPVLERLCVEIRLPDYDPDYHFNIPTLKRLELETATCIFINKVVLNVPNLEYLSVSGTFCPRFVMEDLSSLVETTFCFGGLSFNQMKPELLTGISGVKSLSWSTTLFDVFYDSPLPKFPNLKHLDIKGSFCSSWSVVIQILENSSELEDLCIEEPKESKWIEPRSVPTCMLSNLRTMKFTICKGWKADIRFLEYMLGNAEVLKTLTIVSVSESLSMKDQMEMCLELLKIPRASRYCEIHFVGKSLDLFR